MDGAPSYIAPARVRAAFGPGAEAVVAIVFDHDAATGVVGVRLAEGDEHTLTVSDTAAFGVALARTDLTRVRGHPLVLVSEQRRLIAVATGPATPPARLEVHAGVVRLGEHGAVEIPGDEAAGQPSWLLFELAAASTGQTGEARARHHRRPRVSVSSANRHDGVPDERHTQQWQKGSRAEVRMSRDIPLRNCDERAATGTIDRLRAAHPRASSIAAALMTAVQEARVSEETLQQHSRWCNTEGSWTAGVDPARAAARAMYGFVPERLVAGDGRPTKSMRALLEEYRARLTGQ